MGNNQKDHIYLLTVGTSGVGKATAIGLAQKGVKIVIISRDARSAEKALNEIAQRTGNEQGEYLVADLSLQSSIRKVADEFKRKYNNLHLLANLAGKLSFEKQITPEGIESSFAVNYLSHFLLTNQLLDILKESGPSRVITVGGNPSFIKHAKINFDDLQSLDNFSGMKATAQAMYARVFFAFELARRLQEQNITSNVFNPGVIKSNLTTNAPWYMKIIAAFYKPFEKDICEIGVYLATDPDIQNISGVFFSDKKQIVPFHERFDPHIGQKLWTISEQLTNIKTDY